MKGYLPQYQNVVLPYRYFEFGEPHFSLGFKGRFKGRRTKPRRAPRSIRGSDAKGEARGRALGKRPSSRGVPVAKTAADFKRRT
jgi:hypothetical protein